MNPPNPQKPTKPTKTHQTHKNPPNPRKPTKPIFFLRLFLTDLMNILEIWRLYIFIHIM